METTVHGVTYKEGDRVKQTLGTNGGLGTVKLNKLYNHLFVEYDGDPYGMTPIVCEKKHPDDGDGDSMFVLLKFKKI